MTTRLSSGVGMSRAMNGLEVSTSGTRWKLMSVARELRGDDIHIVVHAAQDGFGDVLRLVAALGGVAVDLLDPFQIDDGHDADQQVRMARHVDLSVFTPPCSPS